MLSLYCGITYFISVIILLIFKYRQKDKVKNPVTPLRDFFNVFETTELFQANLMGLVLSALVAVVILLSNNQNSTFISDYDNYNKITVQTLSTNRIDSIYVFVLDYPNGRKVRGYLEYSLPEDFKKSIFSFRLTNLDGDICYDIRYSRNDKLLQKIRKTFKHQGAISAYPNQME